MAPSGETGQTLVILNPTANRGAAQQLRPIVHAWVRRFDAEYVETTRSGDAQMLARHAASLKRPIVVVGGDGTIHEVVNGILETREKPPLGVVAGGSGNDFAWNTLNLPRDVKVALELAFTGTPTPVDAGTVNGRFFANSFCLGIGADVVAAADSIKHYPLMHFQTRTYVALAWQLLLGYQRCPWLTISTDEVADGTAMPRRIVSLAISNGPLAGAGMILNPKADHRDGIFDICIINYMRLWRTLRLLPAIRGGGHSGHDGVSFSRSRAVYIESRRPINFQIDGEVAQGTTFDVRNLPDALLVRC